MKYQSKLFFFSQHNHNYSLDLVPYTLPEYLKHLQQKFPFNIESFDQNQKTFPVECTDLEFMDRVEAVNMIVKHSNSIFERSVAKSPLFFLHGTTGAGKSRVFYEFSNRFRNTPAFSNLSKQMDFFPIAITFNSSTTLTNEETELAQENPTILVAIRVLYTLLLFCGISTSFRKFSASIRSDLNDKLIYVDKINIGDILELFTQWIGEKVLLLIDEPLHLLQITKIPEETFKGFVHDICALQDGNHGIAVVFSTLKVGIFNQSATSSGRPIRHVGLFPLSIDEIAEVLLKHQPIKGKIALRENNGIELNVWAKTFAALTAGHPRTLEFLIKALKTGTCHSIHDLLLWIVMEYTTMPFVKTQPYIFDLSVVIPLAFSSYPTLPEEILNIPHSLFSDELKRIGEKFWSLKTEMIERPVDDLVSSGILPLQDDTNIPVLSSVTLRYWCSRKEVKDSLPVLAKNIENMICYFYADGDSFEDYYAHWEIVMRLVRQQMSKIFPTNASHQWNSRRITEIYSSPYIKLEETIEQLQFDFTIPLELEWFDEVKKLETIDTKELVSNIWIPKNTNNPGFDSLIFLRSRTDKTYILAIENKYTLEGNTTKLNYQEDIVKKREKAVDELEKAGFAEDQIIFVLMALRPYDKKNQLPKNTIVIDDKAFYKLVGPTVLNVIKSFEVMVRRRKTLKEENKIQKRTRCEAMVVSTGIQCQKPAVDGESHCHLHKEHSK